MAQWLKHRLSDQSVAGSIPSQGYVPQLQVQFPASVRAQLGGNQSMSLAHSNVFSLSLSASLSLPFTLSKKQQREYSQVRMEKKEIP